ncbi:MAG: hypothetical protein JXR76_11380 [Deltaproteobacteria bacterium]|nr:hypothetical protein [Deltaproteobacteria bacterium]
MTPVHEFWLHRSGDQIGDLEVSIRTGNVDTPLTTYTGPLQNGWEDSWERQSLDISAFAGSTVQLVFRCNKGVNGKTSIDHVAVFDK